jgi:hypothetical protein
VGLRAGLDGYGIEKIVFPHQSSNPGRSSLYAFLPGEISTSLARRNRRINIFLSAKKLKLLSERAGAS